MLRFGLLFALLASAAIFDICHPPVKNTGNHHKIPVQEQTGTNKVFFCNQMPVYNLKTFGTDFFAKQKLASPHEKLLLKYHNSMTFRLVKAKLSHITMPEARPLRSLPYNRVVYPGPDGIPLFS